MGENQVPSTTTTTIQETKQFYKTSEFWFSAALQVLIWTSALPIDGSPPWLKTVISAAGVLAYTLSRGVAKSGTPKAVLDAPTSDLPQPPDPTPVSTPQEVKGATEGVRGAAFTPPTAEEVAEAEKYLGPGPSVPPSGAIGPN